MFTEEKKTYHTSSHSSFFAKAFNSIVQLLKSSVDYFFKLEFYSLNHEYKIINSIPAFKKITVTLKGIVHPKI